MKHFEASLSEATVLSTLQSDLWLNMLRDVISN